jgi:hypothetical protein
MFRLLTRAHCTWICAHSLFFWPFACMWIWYSSPEFSFLFCQSSYVHFYQVFVAPHYCISFVRLHSTVPACHGCTGAIRVFQARLPLTFFLCMAVWQHRSLSSFACHRNNAGRSKICAHESWSRVFLRWRGARAHLFRECGFLHGLMLSCRCEKNTCPQPACDVVSENKRTCFDVYVSVQTGWATGSFLGVFEGLRKARQAKLSQQLFMTSVINASGKRGASWGNNLG